MQYRMVICPACHTMVPTDRLGLMAPHTGHPVFSGDSFGLCPGSSVSWFRALRMALLGFRPCPPGDIPVHVRRPETHLPDACR